MNSSSIDLDQLADYRSEYLSVLRQVRSDGDELFALCPFHHEHTGSFHVDLKTGQFHCFGCGEKGNFVTFYAKIHNVDTKEAYREILRKYASAPRRKTDGGSLESYTLEDYSQEKNLPVHFLRDVCKVDTGSDRDGIKYLKTVYLSPGRGPVFRKRYGRKNFRWGRGAKGNLRMYGEWRLDEFLRQGPPLVLVEGESDTQSLWYLGLSAVGVPGAAMFQNRQAKLLLNFPRIAIHQEPDDAGKTFVRRIVRALHEVGYEGEIRVFQCGAYGVKDPSDLFCKYGRTAAEYIRKTVEDAPVIDPEAFLDTPAIPGEPVHLRQPDGFQFSAGGIAVVDPKTGTLLPVCSTPILLSKRLHSLETGEEKVEIAFFRDDCWRTAVLPRSTIFSSRKITDLADLGCTITSENARSVVRFLGALEADNLDRIPVQTAVSSFGWQPGGQFLPGHADGLTLDIDPSRQRLADAYAQSGTLDGWIHTMAPHRSRDIFRFILAASFAAPLLRIVKQRIFFVYNWGNSGGGKTAALKAALSAWGNPERLMVSFNTTQAGLERTAAFYCDLPLGIDERQLAGEKPGDLARKVYMIASGIGRVRAGKTGGLQHTCQWRTVALATGEEPIAEDCTQTGVSTRTLELYGLPFQDESDAARMHQQSVTDCGWAGPAFVERLLAMKESEIVEQYNCLRDLIQLESGGKNGAHIACIATVALADALIDQWFFGAAEDAAWRAAKQMAIRILKGQVEANARDVNENAVRFILDWISINESAFRSDPPRERFGYFDPINHIVYMIPSKLKEALEKAGFSNIKTVRYLEDQRLISVEPEKSGRRRNTVQRRMGGIKQRVFEFFLDRAERMDSLS